MGVPGSINNLLGAAPASYKVERSLRFNSSDSGFCSRTPASAGNRKTWTWAAWVKRSKLSSNMPIFGTDYLGASYCSLYFDSNNTFFFENYSGAFQARLQTTQVFRDPSAWLHIVVALDTTQATAANRAKIYVNGSEVTALTIATYPSQNTDLLINNNQYHEISQSNSTYTFGGYLADIHFIDGQALTPSSFTETSATTGQLIPKKYTGTFTGNSFWLPFSDNSSTTSGSNVGIGKDFSGLGNYWNTTNLSVTAGAGNDSLVDTPSSAGTDSGLGGQVTGNYATLNPLSPTLTKTLANGNLDVTLAAGTSARSTIAVLSGKWYWEVAHGAFTSTGRGNMGVCFASNLKDAPQADSADSYTYWGNTGQKQNSGTLSAYGDTYTTGDVIGFALDLDNGRIFFSKNGVWQASGNPATGANPAFTGLSGTFVPLIATDNNGQTSHVANFGQRPFAYTAPSGFKALCDTNLPTPVVAKSASAFQAITYTGTGANATIPNVNTVPTSIDFTPDLVWIKGRSGATDHALYDSVRDVQKDLVSNSTAAETTQSTGLTAFGTNNFNIGTLAKLNTSSSTYVGWCWDAGTTTTTINANAYSAGVPSITSSVRANASAGFSIVTFTGNQTSGATVGHGLGVAPQMIFLKSRSATGAWYVYHQSTGNTNYLILNTTDAISTSTAAWNNTSPSSTVFTLGNNIQTSGVTQVAYCFAPVAGYSNGFSYTGNGSTDGVFVYLGLRAKLLLIKRTDTTGNWYLWDTVRNTYNVVGEELYPNLSNAAATATDLDILSNGFKMRSTAADFNASGGTYIGFAWAEAPFAYSRAR